MTCLIPPDRGLWVTTLTLKRVRLCFKESEREPQPTFYIRRRGWYTTKCLKALEGGLSTGLSPRQDGAFTQIYGKEILGN
jgi:hypothetical protein